jgi:anionic cell wall polymer biosynthesis LytR-Cps2A-Psr (LCP) family protein
MGLITWIIVIVAILAIIGLGVGTFFSGVWSGAQKVGSNPSVQSAANQAKEFVSNATKNTTSTIVGKATGQ